MANRYRIGSSNNWANAGNWSTTSGGAGGASVPGTSDIAIIDGNTPASTITLSANGGCGGLIWNPSNIVRWSRSSDQYLGIGASGADFQQAVSLNSVANVATERLFIFNNGCVVTSVAQLPCTVGFDAGATLGGNLDILYGAIFSGVGTFNAAGYNISAASYTLVGSNVTLTMGSGTWTATGSGTVWNMTSLLALNANTSTLKFTDTSASTKTIIGGGKTYNIIELAGNAAYSFSTSGLTAALLKATGAYTRTMSFASSQTYTFTGIDIAATEANPVTITASSTNAAVVNAASGSTLFQLAFATMSKITTNTGSGHAFRSTNGGSMTGWVFPGLPSQLFFGSAL